MLEVVLALAAGLIVGSFLNVCIHRMPRDLSVVRPRSFCPSCEAAIAWFDNIPVLSYLLLRGRCRHCGSPISLRYPVVELLTGALFCAVVRMQGISLAAVKDALFAALLVGLIFSDMEERILPDEFTLGGILIGLLAAAVVPLNRGLLSLLLPGDWNPAVVSVAEASVGALVSAFSIWFVAFVYTKLRHREGLGLGDVKMVAMLGAFLGLEGSLLSMLLGSLAGSVIGLSYILVARKNASTNELPFGSFLGAAALAVGLFGAPLMSWYQKAW
jgi:leader peptidase (prepilin peptidase) / N-methyltransferase